MYRASRAMGTVSLLWWFTDRSLWGGDLVFPADMSGLWFIPYWDFILPVLHFLKFTQWYTAIPMEETKIQTTNQRKQTSEKQVQTGKWQAPGDWWQVRVRVIVRYTPAAHWPLISINTLDGVLKDRRENGSNTSLNTEPDSVKTIKVL